MYRYFGFLFMGIDDGGTVWWCGKYRSGVHYDAVDRALQQQAVELTLGFPFGKEGWVAHLNPKRQLGWQFAKKGVQCPKASGPK